MHKPAKKVCHPVIWSLQLNAVPVFVFLEHTYGIVAPVCPGQPYVILLAQGMSLAHCQCLDLLSFYFYLHYLS